MEFWQMEASCHIKKRKYSRWFPKGPVSFFNQWQLQTRRLRAHTYTYRISLLHLCSFPDFTHLEAARPRSLARSFALSLHARRTLFHFTRTSVRNISSHRHGRLSLSSLSPSLTPLTRSRSLSPDEKINTKTFVSFARSFSFKTRNARHRVEETETRETNLVLGLLTTARSLCVCLLSFFTGFFSLSVSLWSPPGWLSRRRSAVQCVHRASVSPQTNATVSRAP